MKKCSRCGRLGLFFYLDENGLCEKCVKKEVKQKAEAEFAAAEEFVGKISNAFADIAETGVRLSGSWGLSWSNTNDIPYHTVQRLEEDCRLILDELPQWEQYPRFEDALLKSSISEGRGLYHHPYIPFTTLFRKGGPNGNNFSKTIPHILDEVLSLNVALTLHGRYQYKTYRIVGSSYDNEDGTSRQDIIRSIKYRAKPFGDKPEITLEKYKYQEEDAVAVYANGLQVGHISRKDLAASLLPSWDRYDRVTDFEILGKSGPYGMDIVVRFKKGF